MYFLYLILLAITSFIWGECGITIDSWEFWVLTSCFIGGYICGKEGRNE